MTGSSASTRTRWPSTASGWTGPAGPGTGPAQAAAGLGTAPGDEWVLFRGYRNRRGEIDHLLLGPRGLFAIESKHRNGTVGAVGDRWSYVKYDNPVEHGEMTDAQGRSPSEQVSQPAAELPAPVTPGDRAELERLIIRDHRHHGTR